MLQLQLERLGDKRAKPLTLRQNLLKFKVLSEKEAIYKEMENPQGALNAIKEESNEGSTSEHEEIAMNMRKTNTEEDGLPNDQSRITAMVCAHHKLFIGFASGGLVFYCTKSKRII